MGPMSIRGNKIPGAAHGLGFWLVSGSDGRGTILEGGNAFSTKMIKKRRCPSGGAFFFSVGGALWTVGLSRRFYSEGYLFFFWPLEKRPEKNMKTLKRYSLKLFLG